MKNVIKTMPKKKTFNSISSKNFDIKNKQLTSSLKGGSAVVKDSRAWIENSTKNPSFLKSSANKQKQFIKTLKNTNTTFKKKKNLKHKKNKNNEIDNLKSIVEQNRVNRSSSNVGYQEPEKKPSNK